MNTYHAIEIVGTGKHTRYCIKRVETGGSFGPVTTCPADRKAYRTELDARDAAARMGIEILKTGDYWQII